MILHKLICLFRLSSQRVMDRAQTIRTIISLQVLELLREETSITDQTGQEERE